MLELPHASSLLRIIKLGGCPMQWLNELLRKYQAAIANNFILHFNIGDLIDGSRPLEDFLIASPLFASRDIVIKYDRSAGITFPRDINPKLRAVETEQQSLPGEEIAVEESEAREILGLDEEIPIPRDPGTALHLIERLLRLSYDDQEARVGLIIDYAETIAPNVDVGQMSAEDRTSLITLLRWAKDSEITRIGTPIILLTENLADLHPALRSPSSRIEVIEIPFPDYEERKKYINELANSERFKDTIDMQIDPDEMARLTAMLKRIHIEDIFLRAEDALRPLDAELVKERKKEILAAEFEEVLDCPDLEEYDESWIGGLDYALNFFKKSVINPIRQGNLRRVAQGVLLSGPSGTGKTLLIRIVAKMAGIQYADLNLAKITDKWVGSSERNLEKAFMLIRALAPCIVVIDEIDQLGFSRETGDSSGVSSRLFRRLLEFMSDPKIKGQVVFIGITNRPDLLDAALKRPGRFDKKIPILAPDLEQRVQILKAIFNRYGIKHSLTAEQFAQIANDTDGYTGAELEALALKVAEVAEDAGRESIIMEDVEYANKVYRPTTQDIEKMTRLALDECNDLDLLPPEWKEKMMKEKPKRQVSYVPRARRA